MTKLFYAGIGSRKTPEGVLSLMEGTAARLARLGWRLRSGGALGADAAFLNGTALITDDWEVFRPEDATREAMLRAEEVHPAWHRCNAWARQAHGRNAMIILGRSLNDHVKFVVCWTPGGKAVGGTATGIKVAENAGIPVFNLHDATAELRLNSFLERLQ